MKKKLYLHFFLLFIYCSSLSLEAKESTRLHIILVTDLKADGIEDGVEKDLKRIQKELGTIAKYTELEVSQKLFLGKRSDPKKLSAHLSDLQVNPDDVIFFYFSGHGYRTKLDEKHEWPSLSFENADVGIRFEEIANALQAKHARLILLFADCCNNKMSLSSAPKTFKPKPKFHRLEIKKDMKAGYRKLFLQAHGTLMIASAKAGEYSYTDDDVGSMFTIALTKGLKEASLLPIENVTWNALLNVSQNKLSKMTKEEKIKQHPIIFNAIID